MDVRCANKLHGILENGVLEVKCNSTFCGHGKGVVVIHYFDLETGELITTQKFKDTPELKKGDHNG